MKVYDDITAWQQARRDLGRDLTLGFVPTMGALHDGHLSLVRRSRAGNDRTLVSIFVNPTQFDDPTDLARYPRPMDADLALLERAGVDFVLAPPPEQMYPDRYRYRVVEREQSVLLEGAFRPGHFDAVLTVVLKLLQLAAADRAYFGEKDWQQLQLVRGMAAAFFLPTAIVGCPVVRADSGLALSSRNTRLAPAEQVKAAELFRILSTAPDAAAARDRLAAAGFEVDYVEDVGGRRLAAVRLRGVRLIDNVPLDELA
jgi:pantoate--beta-alanine ligase